MKIEIVCHDLRWDSWLVKYKTGRYVTYFSLPKTVKEFLETAKAFSQVHDVLGTRIYYRRENEK